MRENVSGKCSRSRRGITYQALTRAHQISRDILLLCIVRSTKALVETTKVGLLQVVM